MYLMLALSREGYRYGLEQGKSIRMPHYAVLATLAEFGSSSQRDITECVGFDKSDVTKIINDLETLGLVERRVDRQDARRHRVGLTAAGQRQLIASDGELNAASRAFLGGLSARDYRQLIGLLLKALRVHDSRFAGTDD